MTRQDRSHVHLEKPGTGEGPSEPIERNGDGPDDDLAPGFGENFIVEGLSDAEVRIDARFAVGRCISTPLM